MSVAVGNATVDGSVKPARWLMPLGVGRRLVEFGAIWLGADIDLQLIGEVVVYFATRKR
mgnify:CR=1 FL=1|jgi:hypothetical protein